MKFLSSEWESSHSQRSKLIWTRAVESSRPNGRARCAPGWCLLATLLFFRLEHIRSQFPPPNPLFPSDFISSPSSLCVSGRVVPFLCPRGHFSFSSHRQNACRVKNPCAIPARFPLLSQSWQHHQPVTLISTTAECCGRPQPHPSLCRCLREKQAAREHWHDRSRRSRKGRFNPRAPVPSLLCPAASPSLSLSLSRVRYS